MLDLDGWTMPPERLDVFPITVGAHESRLLAVSFTPESCEPVGQNWGTLTVDLEIADAWYPTLDRSFELPEPLVSRTSNPLNVLMHEGADESIMQLVDPIVAACAMLDIGQ